jgi:hypothetical protein
MVQKTTSVTIYLPIRERLDKFKADKGQGITPTVNNALDEYLEKRGY